MKRRRRQSGVVVAFQEDTKTGLIRADAGGMLALHLEDFGTGRLYPIRGERVLFDVSQHPERPPSPTPTTPFNPIAFSRRPALPQTVGRAVRVVRADDVEETKGDARSETGRVGAKREAAKPRRVEAICEEHRRRRAAKAVNR